MKLKFGKYVLYIGKEKQIKKSEYNPELMDKLKENSIDVTPLTREEKVRKWQREHREQINARRKDLYNKRKDDGVCVKCGKNFGRGPRPKHSDGTPYLLCKECRKPLQKVKKGPGRPKGSKNKRPVGRPKKV